MPALDGPTGPHYATCTLSLCHTTPYIHCITDGMNYAEYDDMDKRIIFEHTQGPLKGICEIIALMSQIPDGKLPEVLVAGDTTRGRAITGASLLKVTRTYALYREFFDWGHKTDGFHAAQV